MKIDFPAAAPDSSALILLVADGTALTPAAAAAESRTGGQLGRAMKAAGFSGRKASTLELLAPAGMAAERLLLLGLGDPAGADALLFEELGGKAAELLLTRAESAALDLSGLSGLAIPPAQAAAHFALGCELRAWHQHGYRTTLKDHEKPKLARLSVAGAAGAAEAHAPLAAVAAGVALTRTLVTEPANILYPESFVARVEAAVAPHGVAVTVLDEGEMKALGFGALLGVAQGSVRPPRLLVMEWNGSGKADAPATLFVGKGVTFDTGASASSPPPAWRT